MPGPFPGMDPYLEDPAFWRDFHQSFVIYCRDALNDLLPDNYEARTEERLNLVEVGDAYIEVLQRPDRTLIAVLEVLSPWNKKSPDRRQYLLKRNALLRQPVHLIELDLLIGGLRLPTIEPLPRGDYYAVVSREGERTHSEVYAWALDRALPTIRFPLKQPDGDLLLNLQTVFTTTYERGRYARALRYQGPPLFRLPEQVLRWVDEVLAGVRTPPARENGPAR